VLIQSLLEFLPLIIGDRERFRILTNALPEVIDQAEPFLHRQIQ